MNLFTKSIFASILPCAAVSAQGLYSIAPNDDEADSSLPLTYIVGASVGYDNNPTPLFNGGDNDGAAYGSVFAQANFTSVSPQTTWDFFARIGARFYFSAIDGNDINSTNYDARVGVNFTHRFSERLRFSSRNFVAYETEPDFDFGLVGGQREGQYFRYSSENSVGYRWSDRLATQTGVNFSGVIYDELADSDFTRIGLRHDFRYRLSPATVVTAGYRYAVVDADNGGESDSHFFLGGIEHRISPVSAIVLRAGAQINNPDNGDSRTRPFVEASLRSQLTQQLSLNSFVRYSNEAYNRGLTDGGTPPQQFLFEQSQTLRVGARFNYSLNPRVSLFGGVSYIFTDYEDIVTPVGGDEGNESILNLSVGGSYRLTDNLYLTGSYNFTTAFSDFDGREYDRNRVQVGIQATF